MHAPLTYMYVLNILFKIKEYYKFKLNKCVIK